jgi:hypothetical protein
VWVDEWVWDWWEEEGMNMDVRREKNSVRRKASSGTIHVDRTIFMRRLVYE